MANIGEPSYLNKIGELFDAVVAYNNGLADMDINATDIAKFDEINKKIQNIMLSMHKNQMSYPDVIEEWVDSINKLAEITGKVNEAIGQQKFITVEQMKSAALEAGTLSSDLGKFIAANKKYENLNDSDRAYASGLSTLQAASQRVYNEIHRYINDITLSVPQAVAKKLNNMSYRDLKAMDDTKIDEWIKDISPKINNGSQQFDKDKIKKGIEHRISAIQGSIIRTISNQIWQFTNGDAFDNQYNALLDNIKNQYNIDPDKIEELVFKKSGLTVQEKVAKVRSIKAKSDFAKIANNIKPGETFNREMNDAIEKVIADYGTEVQDEIKDLVSKITAEKDKQFVATSLRGLISDGMPAINAVYDFLGKTQKELKEIIAKENNEYAQVALNLKRHFGRRKDNISRYVYDDISRPSTNAQAVGQKFVETSRSALNQHHNDVMSGKHIYNNKMRDTAHDKEANTWWKDRLGVWENGGNVNSINNQLLETEKYLNRIGRETKYFIDEASGEVKLAYYKSGDENKYLDQNGNLDFDKVPTITFSVASGGNDIARNGMLSPNKLMMDYSKDGGVVFRGIEENVLHSVNQTLGSTNAVYADMSDEDLDAKLRAAQARGRTGLGAGDKRVGDYDSQQDRLNITNIKGQTAQTNSRNRVDISQIAEWYAYRTRDIENVDKIEQKLYDLFQYLSEGGGHTVDDAINDAQFGEMAQILHNTGTGILEAFVGAPTAPERGASAARTTGSVQMRADALPAANRMPGVEVNRHITQSGNVAEGYINESERNSRDHRFIRNDYDFEVDQNGNVIDTLSELNNDSREAEYTVRSISREELLTNYETVKTQQAEVYKKAVLKFVNKSQEDWEKLSKEEQGKIESQFDAAMKASITESSSIIGDEVASEFIELKDRHRTITEDEYSKLYADAALKLDSSGRKFDDEDDRDQAILFEVLKNISNGAIRDKDQIAGQIFAKLGKDGVTLDWRQVGELGLTPKLLTQTTGQRSQVSKAWDQGLFNAVAGPGVDVLVGSDKTKKPENTPGIFLATVARLLKQSGDHAPEMLKLFNSREELRDLFGLQKVNGQNFMTLTSDKERLATLDYNKAEQALIEIKENNEALFRSIGLYEEKLFTVYDEVVNTAFDYEYNQEWKVGTIESKAMARSAKMAGRASGKNVDLALENEDATFGAKAREQKNAGAKETLAKLDEALDAQAMMTSKKNMDTVRERTGTAYEKMLSGFRENNLTVGYGQDYDIDLSDKNVQEALNNRLEYSGGSVTKESYEKSFFAIWDQAMEAKKQTIAERMRADGKNEQEISDALKHVKTGVFSGSGAEVKYDEYGKGSLEFASVIPEIATEINDSFSGNDADAIVDIDSMKMDALRHIHAVAENGDYNVNSNLQDDAEKIEKIRNAQKAYHERLVNADREDSSYLENAHSIRIPGSKSLIVKGVDSQAIDDQIANGDEYSKKLNKLYSLGAMVSKNRLKQNLNATPEEVLRAYYQKFVDDQAPNDLDVEEIKAGLLDAFTIGTDKFNENLEGGKYVDENGKLHGFLAKMFRSPGIKGQDVGTYATFARNDLDDESVVISEFLQQAHRADMDRDHMAHAAAIIGLSDAITNLQDKDKADAVLKLLEQEQLISETDQETLLNLQRKFEYDRSNGSKGPQSIDEVDMPENSREINKFAMDLAQINKDQVGLVSTINTSIRNGLDAKGWGASTAGDSEVDSQHVAASTLLLGFTEKMEQDAISSKHAIEKLHEMYKNEVAQGKTAEEAMQKVLEEREKMRDALRLELSKLFDPKTNYSMSDFLKYANDNGILKDGIFDGSAAIDVLTRTLNAASEKEKPALIKFLRDEFGLTEEQLMQGNWGKTSGTITAENFQNVINYVEKNLGMPILTQPGGRPSVQNSATEKEKGKQSTSEYRMAKEREAKYGAKNAHTDASFINEGNETPFTITGDLSQLSAFVQGIYALLRSGDIPSLRAVTEGFNKLEALDEVLKHIHGDDTEHISHLATEQTNTRFAPNTGFQEAVETFANQGIVYDREGNAYKTDNIDINNRHWYKLKRDANGEWVKDDSTADLSAEKIAELNRLGYDEKTWDGRREFYGPMVKGNIPHEIAEIISKTGANDAAEAFKILRDYKNSGASDNQVLNDLLDKISNKPDAVTGRGGGLEYWRNVRAKEMRALGYTQDEINAELGADLFSGDGFRADIATNKMRMVRGPRGKRSTLRELTEAQTGFVDEQGNEIGSFDILTYDEETGKFNVGDYKTHGGAPKAYELAQLIKYVTSLQLVSSKISEAMLKNKGADGNINFDEVNSKKLFNSLGDEAPYLSKETFEFLKNGVFDILGKKENQGKTDDDLSKLVANSFGASILTGDEKHGRRYDLSERILQNDVPDDVAEIIHKLVIERKTLTEDEDKKLKGFVDPGTAVTDEYGEYKSKKQEKQESDDEEKKNKTEILSLLEQIYKWQKKIDELKQDQLKGKNHSAEIGQYEQFMTNSGYNSALSEEENVKNLTEGKNISADGIQDIVDKLKEYNKLLDENRRLQYARNRDAGVANKTEVSFWDVLTNSMQRSMYALTQYNIANKVIRKIPQDVKKVINITKELDKVVTDLRIVTGASSDTAKEYINTYMQLADQLGVTTVEVAKGASEWLRQGYTIQESQKLVTASMQLSKLGMMDAGTATKNLTSSLKGFKLEAIEASSIVDKLVTLDMDYATSAGQIATALSKVSAVAKNANLNLDETASIVTVLMDVTQQEAGSVGTALQTILSRYGNVKAGSFLSMAEEGEDSAKAINDIEKVLSPLGIKIRNSAYEMRDFTDVMTELADRWVTLSDVERNAISTAFAGTRQRNYFNTLVTSWNEVQEAQEISMNSAGNAEKKYKAYTESIATSVERITNAWQKFTSQLELSGVFKAAAKTITWLVDHLDGLLTTAMALGGSKLFGNVFDGIKNSVKNGGLGGSAKSLLGKFAPTVGGNIKPDANPQIDTTNSKLDDVAGNIDQTNTKLDGIAQNVAGIAQKNGTENDGSTGQNNDPNIIKSGKTGKSANDKSPDPTNDKSPQPNKWNRGLKDIKENAGAYVKAAAASAFSAAATRALVTEEKYGGEKAFSATLSGLSAIAGQLSSAWLGPFGPMIFGALDTAVNGPLVEWYQKTFHGDIIALEKKVEMANAKLEVVSKVSSVLDQGIVDSLMDRDEMTSNDWKSWYDMIDTLDDSMTIYDEEGNYDVEKTAENMKAWNEALADNKDIFGTTVSTYDEALRALTEHTDEASKVMLQLKAAETEVKIQSEIDANILEKRDLQNQIDENRVATENEIEKAKKRRNTKGMKQSEIDAKVADIEKRGQEQNDAIQRQINAIDKTIQTDQYQLDGIFKSGIAGLNAVDIANSDYNSVLMAAAEASKRNGNDVFTYNGVTEDFENAIKKYLQTNDRFGSLLSGSSSKSVGSMFGKEMQSNQEAMLSRVNRTSAGKDFDKFEDLIDLIHDTSDDGTKQVEEIANGLGITTLKLRSQIEQMNNTDVSSLANKLYLTTDQLKDRAEEFWFVTDAMGTSIGDLTTYFSDLSSSINEIATTGKMSQSTLDKMLNQYSQFFIDRTSGQFSQKAFHDNTLGVFTGGNATESVAQILAAGSWGDTNIMKALQAELSYMGEKGRNEIGLNDDQWKRIQDANTANDAKSTILNNTAVLERYSAISGEVMSQMEYFEEYIKTLTKLREAEIDAEIENLTSLKDAVTNANKEREKEIKLENARKNLEDAKEKKNRVYRAGVGFVYETDTEAVDKATEELEAIHDEIKAENFQYQIDLLQQQKTLLEHADLEDNLDNIRKELKTLDDDFVEKMFDDRISKNFWKDVIDRLNLVTTVDGKTIEEKLNDQNQGKNIIKERVGSEINDLAKAYKEVIDAAKVMSDKNETVENKRKAVIDRNAAAKTYNEMRTKIYGDEAVKNPDNMNAVIEALNEAFLANGGIMNGADIAGNTYNLKDDYSLFPLSEGGKYVASTNLTNFSAVDKTVGSYLNLKNYVDAFLDGNPIDMYMTDYFMDLQPVDPYSGEENGSAIYEIPAGNYSEIDKGMYRISRGADAVQKMTDLSFIPQYLYIDEDGIGYYSERLPRLTDWNGSVSYNPDEGAETPWTGKKTHHIGAQRANGGMVCANERTTLINEEGLEGIITPQGTITSLPANTGIVPADLTKNLYQLGEVAPNLIQKFYGQNVVAKDGNCAEDNSTNIHNLYATIHADSGFDWDKFMIQVHQVIDTTKNN